MTAEPVPRPRRSRGATAIGRPRTVAGGAARTGLGTWRPLARPDPGRPGVLLRPVPTPRNRWIPRISGMSFCAEWTRRTLSPSLAP